MIIYKSLKSYDENDFQEEVSRIPFQICELFSDISDQYWVRKQRYTNVLDQDAHLKGKTLREDNVPYMHSTLRN